jgi:hypothetical protein
MVAYSRSGHFGRTRTLNPAAYCASMSTVSAGQQRNGQVAGVRDTVYGSALGTAGAAPYRRINASLAPLASCAPIYGLEGPLPAGCLRSQRQSTRLADEQGYDQVTWLTL